MPKISTAVRSARKLTAKDLTNVLEQYSSPQYELEVIYALDASKEMTDRVWNLYSSNMMAALKPSSFGWNPSEKKKEIFDKLGRLLLVSRLDSNVESDTQAEKLVAFASFRYDVEPDPDENIENVLYLYEVQVSASARKRGLGKLLMKCMETLAVKGGMHKVMLTVLKDNEAAIKLYGQAGLLVDPNSPIQSHPHIESYPQTGEGEWEDDDNGSDNENAPADYLVLSKIVV